MLMSNVDRVSWLVVKYGHQRPVPRELVSNKLWALPQNTTGKQVSALLLLYNSRSILSSEIIPSQYVLDTYLHLLGFVQDC